MVQLYVQTIKVALISLVLTLFTDYEYVAIVLCSEFIFNIRHDYSLAHYGTLCSYCKEGGELHWPIWIGSRSLWNNFHTKKQSARLSRYNE